jgi:hypothetical protein
MNDDFDVLYAVPLMSVLVIQFVTRTAHVITLLCLDRVSRGARMQEHL